jgi:hypothetical protein
MRKTSYLYIDGDGENMAHCGITSYPGRPSHFFTLLRTIPRALGLIEGLG